MKKFILFLSIFTLFTQSISFSASPRLSIMETFSSGGVMASYDADRYLFPFYDEINKKGIPLVFHTSYPSPSYDPLYRANSEMNDMRTEYYDSPQAPTMFINGSIQTDISDLESHRNIIENVETMVSPITITVEEDRKDSKTDIKVKVISDEEISNKKLRVCVVEYYHLYIHMTGTDQEIFHYTVREMLPDAYGIDINIEANKEFEFNYTFFDNEEWTKDQQFIVAFIQDDESQEILQAGTNLTFLSPEFNIENKFLKTAKNSSTEGKFELINTSPISTKYNISYYTYKPDGFEDCITNDTLLTLDADESKEIPFEFVRKEGPCGLARLYVTITPETDKYGVCRKEQNKIYSLAEETKHIAYSYYYDHYFDSYCFENNLVEAHPQLVNKIVAMNVLYSPELLDGYPPIDNEFSYIATDYYSNGVIGKKSRAATHINNAIDAGKKVMISAEVEGFWASSEDGTVEAKELFFDKLKIKKVEGLFQRVQINNGSITGILPYTLKGINSREIGKDLSYNLNNSNSTHHPFAYYSELLIPEANSPSEAFCYYDNNNQKIAGITAEINDAKVLYVTFPPDVIDGMLERKDFFKRVSNWFFGGKKQLSSVDGLGLGWVNVGEKDSKTVMVKNIIDSDVNITNFEFLNNDGSFSLKNELTLPFKLKSGDSLELEIEFSPKLVKRYEDVQLVINTEDSYHMIGLVGIGLDPVGIDTDDENHDVSLYPNPMTQDYAVLEIKESDDELLEIELLDIFANKLKNIEIIAKSNSTFIGRIDKNELSSGLYFVKIQFKNKVLHKKLVITK